MEPESLKYYNVIYSILTRDDKGITYKKQLQTIVKGENKRIARMNFFKNLPPDLDKHLPYLQTIDAWNFKCLGPVEEEDIDGS